MTDPENLQLEVLAFLKNKRLNQVWYLPKNPDPSLE